MSIVKPNCFEKTKVRWGIFKKLFHTKLHSEQVAPLAANYLLGATITPIITKITLYATM